MDYLVQIQASVLTLIGIYFLSFRKDQRLGNWFSLFAQVPWIYLLVHQNLHGLWVLEAPLTAMYAIASIRELRQYLRQQATNGLKAKLVSPRPQRQRLRQMPGAEGWW